MKTQDDLKTTQRLPVHETMADLVASDPGRYYAHKIRIERIDLAHQPSRKWRVEGLLRMLKAIGLVIAVAGWTFAACDARADQDPFCGKAQVAQAQADLTAGAHLLASYDPVTSLLGYQLMQSAAARRDAVIAVCYLLAADRAKPWGDDAFDDTSDPFERVRMWLTRDELIEAAAILGMDVENPARIQAAIEALWPAKANPWRRKGGHE
jgi:hypothetical protein